MSRERKINVKVDTSNLPKWESGACKGQINWKESVGYKVKFIYEDINGEMEIVDRLDNGYLLLKYKDRTIEMSTGNLMKGHLGKLLGLITNEFKYNIGDNIKDDKRDITVIDREIREVKIKDKKCKSGYTIVNQKWYKYHCNIDGNEDWIIENALLNQKQGCNVCSNQKPMLGVNTIWDTDRWMCDLGVSEEDAKTHTHGTRDVIEVICPYCGRHKKCTINTIYNSKSISCICGDGYSYPNKFIFKFCEQLLQQEQIKHFEIEYKIKNKKYDIYIVLNNEQTLIIENHGGQHGEFIYNGDLLYVKNVRGFKNLSNRNDIKEDIYKCKLAYKNGIDNYIQLDCSVSDTGYVKRKIESSVLVNIFDLTNINWLECEKHALKNIIKEVCDYWNNNKSNNKYLTTGDIAKEFKINSTTTIVKYLKRGTELGWCNYNPEEEKYLAHVKASKISSSKRLLTVLMYDKNMNLIGEYESATWLSEHSVELFGFKLERGYIVNVCNGKKPRYKGYIFKYKKDIENIS